MSTQFPETFDPTTQEGNSWDVLPVREYVAQVVEASIQQPNSGDGYYLARAHPARDREGQARRLRGQEQNLAHFAVGGEVGRAGTAGTAGQTGSRD